MPKRTDINKIMIIGAGPIVIGQACEFDYSGSQACKALRQEGYKIILVNSNPKRNPGCAAEQHHTHDRSGQEERETSRGARELVE